MPHQRLTHPNPSFIPPTDSWLGPESDSTHPQFGELWLRWQKCASLALYSLPLVHQKYLQRQKSWRISANPITVSQYSLLIEKGFSVLIKISFTFNPFWASVPNLALMGTCLTSSAHIPPTFPNCPPPPLQPYLAYHIDGHMFLIFPSNIVKMAGKQLPKKTTTWHEIKIQH